MAISALGNDKFEIIIYKRRENKFIEILYDDRKDFIRLACFIDRAVIRNPIDPNGEPICGWSSNIIRHNSDVILTDCGFMILERFFFDYIALRIRDLISSTEQEVECPLCHKILKIDKYCRRKLLEEIAAIV